MSRHERAEGRASVIVPSSTLAATVASLPFAGTLALVAVLGAPRMTDCPHEFRLPGEIEAIRTKIQTCRGLVFRCSKCGREVMSYGRESDLDREIERRRREETNVDRSEPTT